MSDYNDLRTTMREDHKIRATMGFVRLTPIDGHSKAFFNTNHISSIVGVHTGSRLYGPEYNCYKHTDVRESPSEVFELMFEAKKSL